MERLLIFLDYIPNCKDFAIRHPNLPAAGLAAYQILFDKISKDEILLRV